MKKANKSLTTNQSYEQRNNELFKKWAPFYDVCACLAMPIRRKAAAQINLSKNAKVLDMACGTGLQTIALLKRGYCATGVDLSPEMLSKAKQKIKPEQPVDFWCGDGSNIPYADAYFDAACVSFALHDMPEKIAIAVLKEMTRVTKFGGALVITDYHKPKNQLTAWIANKIAKIWETRHYDYFMHAGLEYYLKEAGLVIKSKQTVFLGIFQIVVCVK